MIIGEAYEDFKRINTVAKTKSKVNVLYTSPTEVQINIELLENRWKEINSIKNLQTYHYFKSREKLFIALAATSSSTQDNPKKKKQ